MLRLALELIRDKTHDIIGYKVEITKETVLSAQNKDASILLANFQRCLSFDYFKRVARNVPEDLLLEEGIFPAFFSFDHKKAKDKIFEGIDEFTILLNHGTGKDMDLLCEKFSKVCYVGGIDLTRSNIDGRRQIIFKQSLDKY